MRSKGEYALLWANGATFSEVYDLMELEIRREHVSKVEGYRSKIAEIEAQPDSDENIDDWGDGDIRNDPTYRPCECGCRGEDYDEWGEGSDELEQPGNPV